MARAGIKPIPGRLTFFEQDGGVSGFMRINGQCPVAIIARLPGLNQVAMTTIVVTAATLS